MLETQDWLGREQTNHRQTKTPKESSKGTMQGKLHNIKVYRKNPAGLNIVGFDTLLFARLKVGKAGPLATTRWA